jgi:hypothetical protein
MRYWIEDQTRAPCAIYFPDGLCRVSGVVPREALVVCMKTARCPLLKTDTTIRYLDITDEQIEAKHMDDLLDLVHGRLRTVTKSSREAEPPPREFRSGATVLRTSG